MSKVNLTAKDWCDLVFEGRNKDYGAYRLRAKSGSRQLKSVLIVILVLVAIIVGAFVRAEVKKAMKADLGDNEQVTALSQLKKEDPKKEEKKNRETQRGTETRCSESCCKGFYRFYCSKDC